MFVDFVYGKISCWIKIYLLFTKILVLYGRFCSKCSVSIPRRFYLDEFQNPFKTKFVHFSHYWLGKTRVFFLKVSVGNIGVRLLSISLFAVWKVWYPSLFNINFIYIRLWIYLDHSVNKGFVKLNLDFVEYFVWLDEVKQKVIELILFLFYDLIGKFELLIETQILLFF